MRFHNFFFPNLKLFSSGLFLLAATCDQHCYHCEKYVFESVFYGRLGADKEEHSEKQTYIVFAFEERRDGIFGPGLPKKEERRAL